jgi:CO/xanthine dehydrogenase Mo-binding subunit
MKEPPRSAMAVDKVRCVGDAVAFVIADTIEQARERRTRSRSIMRSAGRRRRA